MSVDAGFVKSMCGLLVFFMVLVIIMSVVSPEPQVNVTEKVMDKEIVHVHKFLEGNDPDYYIYTESYCFNLDLHDYNSLNIGDDVNLSVRNGTSLATLILEDGEYYNV